MRILIVGGGVIGLCAGYELQRRGHEIVVVDASRVGSGASAGNAGWVTPGLARPVPGPGVLAQGLRWALDPRSPLRIHPRLDRDLARWMLRFARACERSRFERGVRAWLALSRTAIGVYERWAADGLHTRLDRSGLILIAVSERGLEHAANDQAAISAQGYEGRFEVLTGTEVRALEPAISAAVVGGVYCPDEASIRPEALCTGLARSIRAGGGQIIEGRRVSGIEPMSGGAVSAPDLGQERFDGCVIATGSQSATLLKELGFRIDLQPARGYSFTVQCDMKLAHSLELVENRIAITPFAEETRVAGTLELGVRGLPPTASRQAVIAAAPSRYLDGWTGRVGTAWHGDRPLVSDGLPVIDKLPLPAPVFLATGHSMLGVTSGPPTAVALADYLEADRRPAVLEPFRLRESVRIGRG